MQRRLLAIGRFPYLVGGCRRLAYATFCQAAYPLVNGLIKAVGVVATSRLRHTGLKPENSRMPFYR